VSPDPIPESPSPAPPARVSGTAAEDRVPAAQKIAYGLGSCHDMWGHWLYPNVAPMVFNIYLGVPVALVTSALTFNRFFDAISDPVFGRLSDNTRTRYGRRRPYLLFGGILAGILLPMLFFVRPGWSDVAYFWFMLGSSAIFIPVMSSFNMAYQSLGTEMTPDYNERTSLFTFKTAIQKLPELANYLIPQFTTLAVWVGATHRDLLHRLMLLCTSSKAWSNAGPGQRPNALLGAQVGFALLGAVMIVAALLTFTLLRERYYHQVVARHQPKVSLKDTIVDTLRCRPFRLLLLMVVTFAVGQSMVSMLSYYDTIYYVCAGNVSLGNGWNSGMGLGNMVFGALGLPVFSLISRRIGKRHALASALGFSIVMYIATWWLYNPRYPWLLPLIWGMVGMGAAGVWMLYQSILADVMDYDELNTSMRREGSFNACASWLIKVGMAVGTGCSGVLLSLVGFNAKLGSAQTPHALFMMRLLLPAVPVVGLLLAIFFVLRIPLSHSALTEIRAKLEMRRGKV
jgi:GPH family glycoside/pentoside/hexuronide:cation symporter